MVRKVTIIDQGENRSIVRACLDDYCDKTFFRVGIGLRWDVESLHPCHPVTEQQSPSRDSSARLCGARRREHLWEGTPIGRQAVHGIYTFSSGPARLVLAEWAPPAPRPAGASPIADARCMDLGTMEIPIQNATFGDVKSHRPRAFLRAIGNHQSHLPARLPDQAECAWRGFARACVQPAACAGSTGVDILGILRPQGCMQSCPFLASA